MKEDAKISRIATDIANDLGVKRSDVIQSVVSFYRHIRECLDKGEENIQVKKIGVFKKK